MLSTINSAKGSVHEVGHDARNDLTADSVSNEGIRMCASNKVQNQCCF